MLARCPRPRCWRCSLERACAAPRASSRSRYSRRPGSGWTSAGGGVGRGGSSCSTTIRPSPHRPKTRPCEPGPSSWVTIVSTISGSSRCSSDGAGQRGCAECRSVSALAVTVRSERAGYAALRRLSRLDDLAPRRTVEGRGWDRLARLGQRSPSLERQMGGHPSATRAAIHARQPGQVTRSAASPPKM